MSTPHFAQRITLRCHQLRYRKQLEFAIFHILFILPKRRLLFRKLRYHRTLRETLSQPPQTGLDQDSWKTLFRLKARLQPLRYTVDSIQHLVKWIEAHCSIASYRGVLRATQALPSRTRRQQAPAAKARRPPARHCQTLISLSRDFRRLIGCHWDRIILSTFKRQDRLPKKSKSMADQCLSLQTSR
jgi:hypothetical protein